jgi:hypothetical protein
LALDDGGVDTGLVQKLTQQQSGRACADDGDLGAGGAHDVFLGSGVWDALKLRCQLIYSGMRDHEFVRYLTFCAIIAQIDGSPFKADAAARPDSKGLAKWTK